MDIKWAYLTLSFLVQTKVLNWLQLFSYYLRFTVTVFPRINALGTYFKIDLGEGHLFEGVLDLRERLFQN